MLGDISREVGLDKFPDLGRNKFLEVVDAAAAALFLLELVVNLFPLASLAAIDIVQVVQCIALGIL